MSDVAINAMHEVLDDFIEHYGKPVVSMCLAAFLLYGICQGYSSSPGWKILALLAGAAFMYLN